VTALPTDVAQAIAGASIDIDIEDDALADALRGTNEDRREYLGDVGINDIGWRVELLFPARMTFEGRTRDLALV
jgi:hypothetical protein